MAAFAIIAGLAALIYDHLCGDANTTYRTGRGIMAFLSPADYNPASIAFRHRDSLVDQSAASFERLAIANVALEFP